MAHQLLTSFMSHDLKKIKIKFKREYCLVNLEKVKWLTETRHKIWISKINVQIK